MNNDSYNENDIEDSQSIMEFVDSIKSQEREMVLTSDGKIVGAILTSEQYEWFLDQLDMQQDTTFVDERSKDLSGSQSLDDLKKELGQ